MAYSKIGIINLALTRIGVNRIASLTEDSAQRIEAEDVYEYALDELLEAADWRFAKYRVALAQNSTAPNARYAYAYILPNDFIRIAKNTKDDPAVYPDVFSNYGPIVIYDGTIICLHTIYPYVIESLEDGTQCLFTDYDNSDYNLILTYIRRITDPAKYTASFVSALSYKLAAEISLKRTESLNKQTLMTTLYERAKIKAVSHNQSLDFVQNEYGDHSWVNAGRT